MLDEVLKNIKEGKGEFEYDGYTVKYDLSPGKSYFEITREVEDEGQSEEILKLVEEFKASIKDIDNKIFKDACKNFKKFSDKSIHGFSDVLNNCLDYETVYEEINNFIDSINYSLDNEIARLNRMKF